MAILRSVSSMGRSSNHKLLVVAETLELLHRADVVEVEVELLEHLQMLQALERGHAVTRP